MTASYYRNGCIYFTGNSTQTLNPANYLTNGPFEDQINVGVTVAALNRSGVYSTTANLHLFNYGTVVGGPGAYSMSTTLHAGAGNAGVYLNASGDVFSNGAKFNSAATATLKGGESGFNPNTYEPIQGTQRANDHHF